MKIKKIVWITGGGSGIGEAIAKEFAKNSYLVIISGRRIEKLKKVATEINKKGGECFSLKMDVRDFESVKINYKYILKKFGSPEVLVNNAAVTYFKKFTDTSISEFEEIISTNLKGYFSTLKIVLPKMIKNNFGICVNIHSVAAIKTFKNSSVYSASKAGAHAMTKCIREEVRGFGIRVIDVLPGTVETEMWSKKILKN